MIMPTGEYNFLITHTGISYYIQIIFYRKSKYYNKMNSLFLHAELSKIVGPIGPSDKNWLGPI